MIRLEEFALFVIGLLLLIGGKLVLLFSMLRSTTGLLVAELEREAFKLPFEISILDDLSEEDGSLGPLASESEESSSF